MIKPSDICPGVGRDDPDHPLANYTHCCCGLPWDPERGWHTKSGIRIPPDVYSRILAREGEAIDVEARREADREAIRAARRMTIGGGR